MLSVGAISLVHPASAIARQGMKSISLVFMEHLLMRGFSVKL